MKGLVEYLQMNSNYETRSSDEHDRLVEAAAQSLEVFGIPGSSQVFREVALIEPGFDLSGVVDLVVLDPEGGLYVFEMKTIGKREREISEDLMKGKINGQLRTALLYFKNRFGVTSTPIGVYQPKGRHGFKHYVYRTQEYYSNPLDVLIDRSSSEVKG